MDKGNDLWIKELDAAKSSSQLVVASVYDGTYASVTMYSKNGDRWKEDFMHNSEELVQKEYKKKKKEIKRVLQVFTDYILHLGLEQIRAVLWHIFRSQKTITGVEARINIIIQW